MSLAFWRRKNTTPDAAGSGSSRTNFEGDDPARTDPTAALRTRARRRLIGAAALLLLVVIVVPMALDPEPKPVADNIPIDIPSEKTKFSPRLALPPVPAPDNVPLAPPPDAAPASASATSPAAPSDAATSPAKRGEARPADGKPAAGTASASNADESRARTSADDKGTGDKLPAAVKGGKFAVQAAATSTEPAARELSERLKKAGLAPYTERIETAEGTRFRVRVGPYANREDAERVRTRLKSLGINANVVGS
jgi:DedD protein